MNFQVLFERLEEQFHLPPGIVHVGDSCGRKREMISQKDITRARGRIPISDAPHRRIAPSLNFCPVSSMTWSEVTP
jgi:hypothetical protein